ncbi:hypothetical protein BOTBODRAFT_39039 [Botryobasidium botryosum FD-172 SS1]|uniref:Uncharacterized protein n=1 Tax=Botryobasidium botryosum (strain FD-172 SS1) TaxID=930990 RepID=A0A067LXP3_BOTB1|nr:hypothetical protein BOTBODRAFT_39039 [Botryobasidium botryosum FD-172 SS1]
MSLKRKTEKDDQITPSTTPSCIRCSDAFRSRKSSLIYGVGLLSIGTIFGCRLVVGLMFLRRWQSFKPHAARNNSTRVAHTVPHSSYALIDGYTAKAGSERGPRLMSARFQEY